MAKKPKIAPKKTHSFLNVNRVLFLLGIIFIISSIAWKAWDIYQTSLPVFKNYQPSPTQSLKPAKLETNPKQLIIPNLKMSLEIEEGGVEKGVWKISQIGVSHLKTSSNPSEIGNIVLYGHNWPALLDKIRQLGKGDEVLLVSADGKVYRYKIEQILIVKPTDVWILDRTDEELLTIYTCTGFLDSKRFVVRAKPG